MLNDDLFNDGHEIDVSLEADFIPYEMYFRKYGVRRIGQFSSPILTETAKIVLPRDAVLLYLPEDDADMGISQNHILLRDATRLIFVNHNIELATKEGFVKRTFTQPTRFIREYLRKNRKTRVLTNVERVARDSKALIIENFALLNHLWIYRPHPLTMYYRWKNVQATLWKRSNEVANTVNRNQYLMVNLPKVLPSVSEFRKAELNINRMTLEAFQDNNTLMLLDIWKWLGDNREESLINSVSPEHYDKIHLILIESGVWTVVNLGLINEWRKTGKEDGEEEFHNGIDASSMQRRFLRLLTTIFEYRNNGVKTADPVITSVIKDEVIDVEKTETVDTSTLPDKDDVVLSDTKNEVLNTPEDKRLVIGAKPTPVDPTKQSVIETDRNKKIQLVSTTNTAAIDRDLDFELDKLDHIFNNEPDAEIHDAINSLPPLEKGIMKKADELAEEGLISAAQYRRIEALSSKYKEIPNPFGEGTLETLATVTSEDVSLPIVDKLPDDPAIIDKSMLNVIIEDMDRKYNSKVLQKDIAATVLNIQKAGIAVTKYDVERVDNIMNDYNSYSIRLAPVNGSPSVIRFKLPNIDDDGSYLCNGVKQKLRKQRVDVPIRKVKENKVALTSYYSKLFVTRSEKVVNNYDKWLIKNFMLKSQEDGSVIRKINFSNSWNNNFVAPRIYSVLAKRFKSFEVGDKFFFFDYENRHAHFGKERVEALEVEGRIVAGASDKALIVVNEDNEFILIDDKNEIDLGNIVDVLQIEEDKSPIEIAEITILNKVIPLGVVLCYLVGFNTLLKISKVPVRKFSSGERVKLADDEFVIKFIDESLIFSKRDKTASLLFGGFNKFKDFTKRYGMSVFNRKDIYYNMLESVGLGLRYTREMDLLNDLWIDPITEGILKDMGEPTEFIPLLMRSTELLLNDWSPDESDMRYQRIRGYERFSGFVYQELVRSIRSYNVQSVAIDASIEMHPEVVWREIDKDVSKYLVQESNPLHNLKEKETVTFSGSGGRSGETMTKGSRVFHQNDLGIVSEASPDNKSVGAIVYLTPNPQFNSLRGTVKKVELNDIENTSLMSTTALISPCADMDDPKRINFINIQHSAGIWATGYKASPLRTGYEKVIAHRTNELFAYTAKKEGTIISLEDDHITIEYKDNEKKTIQLGRRFGMSEGSTIPHQLSTKLKLGDKVNAGDAVAYNEHYFEPDFFNPRRVNWKLGAIAKTVILESTDTLEDSCAISERMCGEMSTKMTKVRNIVVKFDQVVRNLVKPGTHVDLTSILCTIEDPITGNNQLFDDESIAALKAFGHNTPKAKYSGRVEKIEVLYNGDKSDMSDSLREIANSSDKVLKRFSEIKGKENIITGNVDGSMRIDGQPLEIDNMVIKVYITAELPANVGDKMVFGNQMKTIIGRVMSGENKTESGEIIDAVFGYQSISNRIVNSPISMGTTNTLLKVLSQRAVEIYKGKTQ